MRPGAGSWQPQYCVVLSSHRQEAINAHQLHGAPTTSLSCGVLTPSAPSPCTHARPCILQGAVWSCALDPTATLAATGSADFSAKIWDALTGLERASLQHKHIVRTCCFSPDSAKLATGGEE